MTVVVNFLMIKPWVFGRVLSICAVGIVLPQLVCAGSFKIGSINSSPVEETKTFWPLAGYLARQLQSEGIEKGKVVVAESISAMSKLMQAREVDLFIDSMFPVLAVNSLAGSKLMLRRWKRGISEYRSVIFTRKDSGIASLQHLKGKVIAFEEPYATSGYFLPKMVLLKMGLRLTLKRRGVDSVRPDEVGYTFSRGDSNTIFLVLNGVVAAGAVDDQKYLVLANNLGSFNTIHETVPYPRQLVSYRADLPAPIATRVKQVLLDMHRTEEGTKILQAFESTTKFDEIPAQAMELMAELRQHVDKELTIHR